MAAQAVAIGSAVAMAFAVCRRIAGDDLAGLLIALGLLLNTFTAKTVQYVFPIEVFYPVCLLLIVYGVVRKMPVAANGPVRVQGALLPHFPLDSSIKPLTSLSIRADPQEVVVLDLSANPYLFSSQDLRSFSERLAFSGFAVTRTPHGLTVASSLDR